MTLAARQLAVARLLTDPAYQAAFFSATPGDAAEHGLTPEEFRVLRALDRRRLEISSEGYMGKRFERVESAYPRALALLDRLRPDARGHYLATTPFPRSEAEERAVFRAYVARPDERPTPTQRLLEDVTDLETALLALPPPAPLRPVPPDARVQATGNGIAHTRGPLDAALATHLADLATYPDAPRSFVIHRHGSELALEPLDVQARALLDACDGGRTWEDLATDPEAEARLRRWVQQGIASAE